MDVVLGVSVADKVARVALVSDGRVVNKVAAPMPDQVQLGPAFIARILASNSSVLSASGHRVTAIGLCWPNESAIASVRAQLSTVGINIVAAIGRDAAIAGFAKALVRGKEQAVESPSILIELTRENATLWRVDGGVAKAIVIRAINGDATAACAALIRDVDPGVDHVQLVGDDAAAVAQSDQLRELAVPAIVVPADAEFAVVYGVAEAAPQAVGDVEPVVSPSAALLAALSGATGGAQAAKPAAGAAQTPNPAEVLAAIAARAQQARRTTPTPVAKGIVPKAGVAAPTEFGAGANYSDFTVKLVSSPKVTAAEPRATNAKATAETVKIQKVQAETGEADNDRAEIEAVGKTEKIASATTKTAPSEADVSSGAARSTRRRRPLVLAGSAFAGIVVAGVAAVTITGSVGVDPTAEQRPVDQGAQPSVVDQQAGAVPQPAAPQGPALVVAPPVAEPIPVPEQLPLVEPPAEVVEPVEAVAPVEAVPSIVDEVPVETVPEVAVPEAVVPEVTTPDVAQTPVDAVAPDMAPQTQHMPDGVPPAAGPSVAAVPDPNAPQPLPRVEDVVPTPHLSNPEVAPIG